MKRLLTILALLFAAPVAAQQVVTCETLAATIAAAPAGSTVALAPGSDCGPTRTLYRGATRIGPAIVIRTMAAGVTVDLTGSHIAGLSMTAGSGGVAFTGGSITAAEGFAGFAVNGYAVALNGVSNVSFTGTDISDASKGVSAQNSTDLRFTGVWFHGRLGDGIIASKMDGLTVEWSRFVGIDTAPPQECLLPDGSIIYSIGSGPCAQLKGKWTDTYHQDGVQAFGGVKRVTLRFNIMLGISQGIDDFSGLNRPAGAERLPRYNPPNEDWAIYGNMIRAVGYHTITINDCLRCRTFGNDVAGVTPGRKAPIRPGYAEGLVISCGNIDPDDKRNAAPCPTGVWP